MFHINLCFTEVETQAVEKEVEVPMLLRQEVIVEVPQVQVAEVVREMPKEVTQQVVKEVPKYQQLGHLRDHFDPFCIYVIYVSWCRYRNRQQKMGVKYFNGFRYGALNSGNLHECCVIVPVHQIYIDALP